MSNEDNVNEEVQSNEVKKKEEKKPNRLCKGAMPMPLVWYIKFFESGSISEIAKKYFTTPGKITDIKSGNNQKYIVESMTWSKEDLDEARSAVKANFIRGQDDPNATKRQLATTKSGDEAYSLEILDKLDDMEFDENAITLDKSRSNWREANPRATKSRSKVPEADVESDKANDLDDDGDLDDGDLDDMDIDLDDMELELE